MVDAVDVNNIMQHCIWKQESGDESVSAAQVEEVAKTKKKAKPAKKEASEEEQTPNYLSLGASLIHYFPMVPFEMVIKRRDLKILLSPSTKQKVALHT